MTAKDIRPIPNYIMKEIYKRDMKIEPWQTSIVRFYAYLTVWKKELVKVTVAVATIQNKHWACKQVAVHGIHSPIEEANQKQELVQKFCEVAEKYLPLQHNKRSAFICVIAKSPADLIREGELMHHCVGRMNYDIRFAQEESLIFFVRMKEQPDKPLVTLEYSLKTHKVLQCYATHNTKPNEDVLHYVNKIWLPYANKALKQIAA